MRCEGCLNDIKSKIYFRCSKSDCDKIYCTLCANLPSTTVNVQSWTCPACIAQEKKTGNNSSTPVRTSCHSQNVTMRNKFNPKTSTEPSNLGISELTTEIKLLTQEISSLKCKLDEAMTSLTRCHERLDELGNSMASTNTRLASVEQQQAEIHPLKAAVSQIQKNLNMMAQKQLSNEMEIIGIPENKNENLTHDWSGLG
ncbi:unnamed protein product [Parnassius mnemosyne]|uniref:RING-type domain-containing protein n=1 Tax=Parnassius mnemosyne TaxID=213953 RepID=A0AAV1L3B9_9NEOP